MLKYNTELGMAFLQDEAISKRGVNNNSIHPHPNILVVLVKSRAITGLFGHIYFQSSSPKENIHMQKYISSLYGRKNDQKIT